jgi:hypothetical protein
LRSASAIVIDRSDPGEELMRPPTRLSALRGFLLGAAIAAAPGVAFAQQVSPECQKGLDLFKQRIVWIQKIQAMPKKNADPFVACTLFTKLGAANASVLAWAKSNKDWCSIEDNQITGLEGEAKQVGSIRAKSCAVAAQYSKLKAQALEAAKHRQDNGFSVDMSADPLATPVKIPPSAL